MSTHFADVSVPAPCQETVCTGALFVVNTSGGKDSQAMTVMLSCVIPRAQLVAVHAPLGEVKWPGTLKHIEPTLPGGVPLIMAPTYSGTRNARRCAPAPGEPRRTSTGPTRPMLVAPADRMTDQSHCDLIDKSATHTHSSTPS